MSEDISPISSPALASPFNEFFSSFEEAKWGFELLQKTLLALGVSQTNSEDDKRICISVTSGKGGKRLRLNFGNWIILTFLNKSLGERRIEFISESDHIPATATSTSGSTGFKDKIDGRTYDIALAQVANMRASESNECKAFTESLAQVAKRFEPWKGGAYRWAHKPNILRMAFDAQIRDKLLSEGIPTGPNDEYSAIVALEEEDEIMPPQALPYARNIIFYGPPGTGKTYKLREISLKHFTDLEVVFTEAERAAALVKDLAWWEVLALSLFDMPDNRGTVSQILSHPLVDARRKQSANRNARQVLWVSLRSHTVSDCPHVNYTPRVDPLLFSKDEASVWSLDTKRFDSEVPELRKFLDDFRNPSKNSASLARRYKFTTFHQSFSYEDFIEGIKPQLEGRDDGQIAYEIRDGVFKEVCREASANPDRPYALFIDEINRGNVASIFGELITLIEEDKRLGAKNELTVTLPYSRDEFGVPRNLYIIGTMNTADRSVEALDTALRRRFTFEEMRPESYSIETSADLMGKVDLRRLFEVINDRIERLLDHDHCIGHTYLMDVKNLDDLRHAFANKIIPLLREYFYGNSGKVGMVLGDRFVSTKAAFTAFAPGNWGMDDLDEKSVYQFSEVSNLSEEDFASIYAQTGAGI